MLSLFSASVAMFSSVPEICQYLSQSTSPKVKVCEEGPCGGALGLPLYDRDFYANMGMNYYKTLVLYYEVDLVNVPWPSLNIITANRLAFTIPRAYMEHTDPLDSFIGKCTRRSWPHSWINSSYVNGHLAHLFDYDVILVASLINDEIIAANSLRPGDYDNTHVSYIPDVACGVEIAAMHGQTQNVYVMSDPSNAYVQNYKVSLAYAHRTILDVCGGTDVSAFAISSGFPGNVDPLLNRSMRPMFTPQRRVDTLTVEQTNDIAQYNLMTPFLLLRGTLCQFVTMYKWTSLLWVC